MSNTVPLRRKSTNGPRPGKILIIVGDTQEEMEVSDWGLSHDNQTLSLWFADGHEEHLLLSSGDRYGFWPANAA